MAIILNERRTGEMCVSVNKATSGKKGAKWMSWQRGWTHQKGRRENKGGHLYLHVETATTRKSNLRTRVIVLNANNNNGDKKTTMKCLTFAHYCPLLRRKGRKIVYMYETVYLGINICYKKKRYRKRNEISTYVAGTENTLYEIYVFRRIDIEGSFAPMQFFTFSTMMLTIRVLFRNFTRLLYKHLILKIDV